VPNWQPPRNPPAGEPRAHRRCRRRSTSACRSWSAGTHSGFVGRPSRRPPTGAPCSSWTAIRERYSWTAALAILELLEPNQLRCCRAALPALSGLDWAPCSRQRAQKSTCGAMTPQPDARLILDQPGNEPPHRPHTGVPRPSRQARRRNASSCHRLGTDDPAAQRRLTDRLVVRICRHGQAALGRREVA